MMNTKNSHAGGSWLIQQDPNNSSRELLHTDGEIDVYDLLGIAVKSPLLMAMNMSWPNSRSFSTIITNLLGQLVMGTRDSSVGLMYMNMSGYTSSFDGNVSYEVAKALLAPTFET